MICRNYLVYARIWLKMKVKSKKPKTLNKISQYPEYIAFIELGNVKKIFRGCRDALWMFPQLTIDCMICSDRLFVPNENKTKRVFTLCAHKAYIYRHIFILCLSVSWQFAWPTVPLSLWLLACQREAKPTFLKNSHATSTGLVYQQKVQ